MKLVDIPQNPVPPGAVAGEIVARDGVRLRYARWDRHRDVPLRGTVSVFTGRAEFIEKYFETIEDLRRRGFAVAALDWRGQGGSQRQTGNARKGHVRRFSHYERDLEVFLRQVVLPDCPAPHYALAHSMGGSVLLRHARKTTNVFDRMVLSAPMIGLHPRSAPGLLARTALSLLRYGGFSRQYLFGTGDTAVNTRPFERNELTSDRARYDRTEAIIRAAPSLGLGGPTLGWVHAALSTIDLFARTRFGYEVRVPVLMIAAGEETIVSNAAIERLSLHLRGGGHIVIPGAKHELLMERDLYREQFWAGFDAFVRPDDISEPAPVRVRLEETVASTAGDEAREPSRTSARAPSPEPSREPSRTQETA